MPTPTHRPSRSQATRAASLVGSALVLAGALASCGSGSAAPPAAAGGSAEPSAASTAADPCRLLTTADLTAAGLGTTTPEPVETATGGQGCTYAGDGFTGVQVLVQPGGGQAYYAQSKDLLSAAEGVTGFGDEAVLDASNPQQVTLLVRTGDTVLSLGGSVTPDAARALAEKALARLAS